MQGQCNLAMQGQCNLAMQGQCNLAMQGQCDLTMQGQCNLAQVYSMHEISFIKLTSWILVATNLLPDAFEPSIATIWQFKWHSKHCEVKTVNIWWIRYKLFSLFLNQ